MIQQIPFRNHCYIKKSKSTYRTTKNIRVLFQNIIGKGFLDLFFCIKLFCNLKNVYLCTC